MTTPGEPEAHQDFGDDARIETAGASPPRLRADDAETAAGVIVRSLVEHDLDAAADVYLAARHASVPSMPPLVHTDDGVVCGVLVLDGDQIDQLFVDPTQTGRGLGSLLLDRAKEVRPDGLWLWVFVTNEGARRLYAHHGFVESEPTDGTENEEGAPAVRCTWSSSRG
jgi:GNAT superfamily N-acetyltransferase